MTRTNIDKAILIIGVIGMLGLIVVNCRVAYGAISHLNVQLVGVKNGKSN